MKKESQKKIWGGIGTILFIIVAIWGIVGFHMKDIPYMGLLVLGSIICLFVGSKIKLDD